MKKSPAIFAAFVLMMLIGCSSPGELISRETPDLIPGVIKVKYAGEYGLFSPGDDSPMLEFPLNAGDPIGFQKVPDGMVIWLYAIAGRDHRRLEIDKPYEWRKL